MELPPAASRLARRCPEPTREPEIPLEERAAAARASPRWIPDGEVSGCMLCAKSFSLLKSKKVRPASVFVGSSG